MNKAEKYKSYAVTAISSIIAVSVLTAAMLSYNEAIKYSLAYNSFYIAESR
ncbi:MAG: hypothetical protein IJ736_12555 [Firmicutes bacterium]|nr:hypothetical protein [Bacillota bacterium]